MATNVTAQLGSSHRLLSEIGHPRMAKADLRKTDVVDWKLQIGAAIERTRALSGLLLKEFATRIGKDERQVARWIAGTERPQFDAIFAEPDLRAPLVLALASLAHDIEVAHVITIRRSA